MLSNLRPLHFQRMALVLLSIPTAVRHVLPSVAEVVLADGWKQLCILGNECSLECKWRLLVVTVTVPQRPAGSPSSSVMDN